MRQGGGWGTIPAVSQGWQRLATPTGRLLGLLALSQTVSYWSPLACGHKHSAVPISSHGHQHLALAHLLQGTGQAVEVPVILLQGFPEVQDHARGTSFGGEVIQVPVGRKEKRWLPSGDQPLSWEGPGGGRL